MSRFLCKRLALLLSTLLVLNMFAAAIPAFAQTSSDNTGDTTVEDSDDRSSDDKSSEDDTTSDDDKTSNDDSSDSDSSNDQSSDDNSSDDQDAGDRPSPEECKSIGDKIKSLEDKMRENSDNEEELERIKKEIAELKEKGKGCEPKPRPEDDDRQGDEDKTGERDGEREGERDEEGERKARPEMSEECRELVKEAEELKKKIDEAEQGETTDEEDAEIKEMKEKLDEMKEKIKECRDENRDEDGREDRSGDRDGEASEACRECAKLRLKLHRAIEKSDSDWRKIKDMRAKIERLTERMNEDKEGDDDGEEGEDNEDSGEDHQKEIDELKKEAQELYEKWQEIQEEIETAKAELEACQEEIKEECPDSRPRVSDKAKRPRRPEVDDRAATALFVQWGNISERRPDQERSEWNVNVKIDDGSLRVKTPVLFEKNDEEVETESDSSVAATSVIAGHWDGLLIQVKPGKDASELVVEAGDFVKSYEISELYDLDEMHTLDNEMEVAIYSTVPARGLAKDKYEKLVDRKDKALEKLHEIDEKLREHSDNGKFDNRDWKHYNKFRNEVERYLIPEDGEDEFEEFLEECEGLIEDEADEEDIKECEDKLKDLRRLQAKFKTEDGLIPFEDVDDNTWFFEFVAEIKDAGIVSGREDGTYGPGENATRAEMLKMAMEAAGQDLDADEDDIPEDSREHWARKYIAKGLKKNFVKGFEDGKEFRPNAPVTRAEALKIIFTSIGIEVPECEAVDFEDTEGHWAQCIVDYAQEIGVIDGNPDGTFKPDAPITRAAIAKIIRNAIRYAQQQNDGGEEVSDEEIAEVEEEIGVSDGESDSEENEASEDESSDDDSDDTDADQDEDASDDNSDDDSTDSNGADDSNEDTSSDDNAAGDDTNNSDS